MRISTLLLLTSLFSVSAFGLTPGDKVDNFKLLDHTGKMHELYYLSDMKAVVLLVQGNGCPIARNALHTYKELRDKYQEQGVAFLMINSNLQDKRKSIAKEAEEFGIDFPILVDDTQLIGESLGIERTADAFVIEPKTWKIVYRGSLDDRLGYETQKFSATQNYVADALDSVLQHKPLAVTAVEAKGCIVNLPELDRDQAHQQISYADDIAPVLIEKCVGCHREGGIGPFAMSEYNMIKGFAPMIREVIRTKRMPPWHADPHYGEYSNDRSLSDMQAETIVHWIEAGAPRGKGEDPLANYHHEFPQWAFGKPDYILDIPPTDVPATGVVDYKYVDVKNTIGKDVWIKAVQLLPGSREVLHHAIITYMKQAPSGSRGIGGGGSIPGYVPGDAGYKLPEGTGILLPKDSTLQFQLHYTTYGKPATDASKLGIYVYDEKPQYELQTQYMANVGLRIPAGDKEHWEKAEVTLKRDIMIYTLLPHSHFRGKASDFIAKYPDGTEEVLLSVPNYDFNWQTTYFLKDPKILPAGTKLIHHTAWDNSTQNPANPDPTVEVRWGEQSWEEMLFGAIRFRYLDPQEGDGQVLVTEVQ